MPRLRTVSPAMPGWRRIRAGRSFRYTDEHGAPLPGDEVARIKALAIPPAWKDVWISPYANGHIQAVGTDDAGRRQYLYHSAWRERRDKLKFDRVLAAAARMPQVRRRIAADLAAQGMPMHRATALAVRLLDLGYFRIGSDAYADANGSFGLTTLERQHVRKGGDGVVFTFVGKSGIEHRIVIDDADVLRALDRMRRRRDDSPRLLAYREGRRWVDLDAAAVNAYLAGLFDGELTAKDFRTWHATVIAATALASAMPDKPTKAAKRRAVKAAVEEVAAYLGNTPAIARKSYIDPRVLDLFEGGRVAQVPRMSARTSPARRQALLEKAVLELLA